MGWWKGIVKHKETRNWFATATLVFDDEYCLEGYDILHSNIEDRYIAMGLINKDDVIVVAYTSRNSDSIRIILTRLATNKERNIYYGINRKRYWHNKTTYKKTD